MKRAAFGGLFLAVFGLGLFLRLAQLDLRPFHHDEANQAVKFGALLERGEYRYDPAEHHGPTLYYLTLPAAWARGQASLAALDESTMRLVPALFGAFLILLFLALRPGMSREALLAAALLAAFSPALTYFSRFYIQESLFAFFAWAFLFAIGRYFLHPGWGGALAAGLAAGLLYATKETSALVFAAAAAGLIAARIFIGSKPDAAITEGSPAAPRPPVLFHIAAGAAAGVGTAFLFYSSFFRNPGGIVDSLAAFKDYLARGTETGLHNHPWDYYLRILSGTKSGGFVWSEAFILGLAAVGIAAAFLGRRSPAQVTSVSENSNNRAAAFWPVYLASTTLLLTLVYSALPYKTPWNMVVFQAGFTLLAGYGAAALLRMVKPDAGKIVLVSLFCLGAGQLERQNIRAQFVYPADPRNPYVYAQTSPDFERLAARMRELAAVHPHGRDMLIKVVAEADEQWPLPWSLRGFRRVGYWTSLAEAGGTENVPVVIASAHPAEVLEQSAGEAFQVEYYGLRPDVLLTVFIERSLWDRYLAGRSER